jgi:hypothetical protein
MEPDPNDVAYLEQAADLFDRIMQGQIGQAVDPKVQAEIRAYRGKQITIKGAIEMAECWARLYEHVAEQRDELKEVCRELALLVQEHKGMLERWQACRTVLNKVIVLGLIER